MHSIRADGVVGNLSQVLLLVTTVQVGAGYIDPSRVCSRNSDDVDIDGRKLVDRIGGNERPIVLFENLTASLLPNVFTERPFICHIGSAIDPDIRSDRGLDLQPTAC